MQDTPKQPPFSLQAWLERHGYTVSYATGTWTECLVRRREERWFGKGGDERDALAAVIHHMLPSYLARVGVPAEVFHCLEPDSGEPPEPVGSLASAPVGALTDDPHAPHDDERSDVREWGVGEIPTAATPPIESETTPSDSEEQAAEHVGALTDDPLAPHDDERSDLQKEARGVEVSPTEATSLVELEEMSPDSPVDTKPEAPHVIDKEPPRMAVSEALREFAPLWDRIRSETSELGMASPERQRLVILSWICQARELADASGYESPVVDKVSEIARFLTSLTKRWWPGSIRALQVDTLPEDLMDEVDLDHAPTYWSEVAEAAEDLLEQVVEGDVAEERDEYGWIDDDIALHPSPLDPESDLRELGGKLTKLTGPLDSFPPITAPGEIESPSQEQCDNYLEWCRLARWLRGWVIDFDYWGNVMGRLRWLVAQLPGYHRQKQEMQRILDPAFLPRRSWAKSLGRDPAARKQKRQIKHLYDRLHELPANGQTDALSQWIQEALPLLEPDALATCMQPYRESFLQLDPEEFTDSRMERRRLRKAQSRMDGSKRTETAAGDSAGDYSELPEEAADEADETGRPVQDAGERLLDVVRSRTEGKHVIFVSNRNDPDLVTMLKEGLGFAEIVWCEGGPRLVDSVTAKIVDGNCDYVLAATGFQSHSVDSKLYLACKRAEVPYIRVNKGRLIATARAIAKTLDLLDSLEQPA